MRTKIVSFDILFSLPPYYRRPEIVIIASRIFVLIYLFLLVEIISPQFRYGEKGKNMQNILLK